MSSIIHYLRIQSLCTILIVRKASQRVKQSETVVVNKNIASVGCSKLLNQPKSKRKTVTFNCNIP